MKHTYTFKHTLTAIFLAVFVLISSFVASNGAVTRAVASAANDCVVSTDVLDDLATDPEFDAQAYPVKAGDNTLKVIQIAESTDGELLIYVYQPSALKRELTATSINISPTVEDSLRYHNYKLELLNKNGVFHKYRVKNFELRQDMLRYYDISSIFRKWDEDIDKDLPSQNENIITEVAFEVGQQWTACTINGEVFYHMETSETIEIPDKYVGYVRYSSDMVPWWAGGVVAWTTELYDSHYIAFDTDFPIDTLLEADVYYVSQLWTMAGFVPAYGAKTDKEVHLTYKDKQTHTTLTGFWNKTTYTWDRIQTVEEFAAENDLTVEGNVDLMGKKWVLRFCETATELMPAIGTGAGTSISDVTILRLKFETDGVVYNLGVVDNKQSPAPDQAPDNQENHTFADDVKDAWDAVSDFFQNLLNFFKGMPVWKIVLIIIGSIIGIIFVIFIVVCLVKGGVKLLWRVLTAPFRKLKERREQKRQEKAQAKKKSAGKKT